VANQDTNILKRIRVCFSVFFFVSAKQNKDSACITIKTSFFCSFEARKDRFWQSSLFPAFNASLRLGDFKDVVWISSQDGICNWISFTVGCLQMTESALC